MEAFKLIPCCKEFLWGGYRLKTEYGKNSDVEKIAESWELSCHKDGLSVVANGTCKGQTLYDIVDKNKAYLGKKCKNGILPILIKFIDARDNLSVQVHPDDDFAAKYENSYGKNEMWYILDAAENAKIIYGLNKEYSKEDFEKFIKDDNIEATLNYVPVKKGDIFYIQSGTVHAIGKNILIAEVQQASNITYRLYDYKRLDKNGQARDLHIKKALQVADTKPVIIPDYAKKYSYSRMGYISTNLVSCEFFNAEELTIFSFANLVADEDSFNAIVVLEGSLVFEGRHQIMKMKKGETFFVPADYGSYTLKGEGKCLFVKM